MISTRDEWRMTVVLRVQCGGLQPADCQSAAQACARGGGGERHTRGAWRVAYSDLGARLGTRGSLGTRVRRASPRQQGCVCQRVPATTERALHRERARCGAAPDPPQPRAPQVDEAGCEVPLPSGGKRTAHGAACGGVRGRRSSTAEQAALAPHSPRNAQWRAARRGVGRAPPCCGSCNVGRRPTGPTSQHASRKALGAAHPARSVRATLGAAACGAIAHKQAYQKAGMQRWLQASKQHMRRVRKGRAHGPSARHCGAHGRRRTVAQRTAVAPHPPRTQWAARGAWGERRACASSATSAAAPACQQAIQSAGHVPAAPCTQPGPFKGSAAAQRHAKPHAQQQAQLSRGPCSRCTLPRRAGLLLGRVWVAASARGERTARL